MCLNAVDGSVLDRESGIEIYLNNVCNVPAFSLERGLFNFSKIIQYIA
jgi:hypothetical protein